MKMSEIQKKTNLETVDPSQMREQFTFYRSYYDAISSLPKRRQLAIYDAICGYALYGTEPKGLNTLQRMSFFATRAALDLSREETLSAK